MANHKTGAQRYNDRMDKIFKRSEELGHHSLHADKELLKSDKFASKGAKKVKAKGLALEHAKNK